VVKASHEPMNSRPQIKFGSLTSQPCCIFVSLFYNNVLHLQTSWPLWHVQYIMEDCKWPPQQNVFILVLQFPFNPLTPHFTLNWLYHSDLVSLERCFPAAKLECRWCHILPAVEQRLTLVTAGYSRQRPQWVKEYLNSFTRNTHLMVR